MRETPREREGMAELTVPSHHGNPFDMQLPYLLPISELYSAIYFVSLYKRYTARHIKTQNIVFIEYIYTSCVCVCEYFQPASINIP